MFKFLITAFVAVLPLACGPVVKVNVKGTKDGVTITTHQSASDSSSLHIQVNPNINLNPIK